jgi:hypothetical protein
MEMIPRRDLLVAPLLATAATSFRGQSVEAAGVDTSMTQVVQADAIPWKQLYNFPNGTAEQAPMHGMVGEPGQYFLLIRWHPGYMSAPHFYETDRLCVVVSGTWWVASGEDFAPESTVPVTAGGFVRRVARTPHYDGVRRDAKEPAIIAISGIGPIHYHLTDSSQPGWRKVLDSFAREGYALSRATLSCSRVGGGSLPAAAALSAVWSAAAPQDQRSRRSR